jgi:hypothetical protein
MPIIIDANRAGDFSAPLSGHAPEILRRVSNGKVRVALGGKLLKELSRTAILPLLAEWTRSGSICRADNAAVDNEELRFARRNIKSDDPHVLALAAVSGSRLLYSEDIDLINDFKDINKLSPKGKVIKKATHATIADALLRRFGS